MYVYVHVHTSNKPGECSGGIEEGEKGGMREVFQTMHTRACTHARTHARAHVHMRVHAHTHTHTHLYVSSLLPSCFHRCLNVLRVMREAGG